MNDSPERVEATYELPDDQDWLLTQLVQWAELGLSTGVTLFVGGSVVSGILTGEDAYISKLREGFAEGLAGSPSAEPIDRALASMLEAVKSPPQDEGSIPYPRYAHLRDAQVFAPGSGPMPSNEAISLRIKLGSVDSFSLGIMAMPE